MLNKVRPRLVLPPLFKYLEKNNIPPTVTTQRIEQTNNLPQYQHGFRPEKPINAALPQLCESISNIWEAIKQ